MQRRKRPIFGILLVTLMICLIAGNADTLDYPHTAVNNINCDSCHLITNSNEKLVDASTDSQDLDDTIFNNLCWGCHNDTGGGAPAVQTHSYLQIDDDYGEWSVECRTCHNPHTQRQVKTYGSDTYLTTGASTGVTLNNPDNGKSKLVDMEQSWETDEFEGLSLIPNTVYRRLGYKILSNTSNTITVEGLFDTDYIASGNTYAVVYGKIVKETIVTGNILNNTPVEWPKDSGEKTVRFFRDTGTNSFADDNEVYDGICEVCHTETANFRNTGGVFDSVHENKKGADCINCHSHEGGFAHGSGPSGHVTNCVKCHGHDTGYIYNKEGTTPYVANGAASMGAGTYRAHSTHTEFDSDDIRGPADENDASVIYCNTCHDIANMPYFNAGTDADEDGNISLAETTVCDACHSPGGTYDGVNDAVIGAKNNWSDVASAYSKIYTEDNPPDNPPVLRSGKEKWCAGCHDESASTVDSVSAPNVIGDEDDTSYIYGGLSGTGWGFYKTGHGLPSSETYPSSGGVSSGAGKECLDCHLSTLDHTDGDARTFDCSNGCDTTEYQVSYRLQRINGNDPMEIPWTGAGSSDVSKFRLCVQEGCHATNAASKFTTTAVTYTNLITQYEGAPVNRHNYHLALAYQNRYRADYDFSQSVNSRINCVICHNVHGSTQLAMVRDGKLISREPGLKIWYNNDDIVSYNTGNTDPPDPEDLPLAASSGTVWRPLTAGNLCGHCHGNNNTEPEYRNQDPYQQDTFEQAPSLDWTGETNYTSDGVNPDSALAESTFTFRVKYTDTNNHAPSTMQLWIDRNDDTDYEDVNEQIDMDELDSEDTNRTDGKIYTKTITLSKVQSPSDNTFIYRFYAVDSTAREATGNEPVTSGGTVTVTDNTPTLDWTGETYYTSDGVNPDVGGNGSTFDFRVKYTDIDSSDGCPTSGSSDIQVWIDVDDDGLGTDGYETDERFNLVEDDAGDTDCTNGKIYKYSKALTYITDGTYNYRFYATGGGATATGDPVSDSNLTVTESSNNPPLLEWHSSNCLSEGVRPSTGAGGTEYEFMVKYSDADAVDGCPTDSNIQVWIDKNDDGDYDDDNEKINLSEDDGADTDCTDGKIYKDTEVLNYNGDGGLNYRFYAYDGTAAATGTPVSDTTLTALVGYTVRPSGSSNSYDYTSVIDAANAVSGNIIVYPNDDFSAATYSENITLNNRDNLTIQSACGADLTIVSSATTGHTVTVQDSSNFVMDGFSVTGATNAAASASGFMINRVDGTTATIRNNKVYGNYLGFYINDADNVPVQIEDTEIYSNTGRGIIAVTDDDDFDLLDSEIYSNGGSLAGAGIYINGGGTYTITRTTIRDNVTSAEGGAVYISGGNVTIENSILADNQGSNGGAIRTNNGPTLNIVNSTIADNTATGYGGVFYVCAVGTTNVRNTIFWGNTATTDGAVSYKACGSSDGYITITDSSVSTSGNNFGGGTPTVSNNITPAEDPLFVNASSDNWHLQSSSPMIDQANADYAPADDIDGDTRPRGDADDIGADEYVAGTNNLPGLEWTGETNYTSDGVNPDSSAGGSSFVFRVKYTDADNQAPSVIQVWVDEDDSGTYSVSEEYDMTIDGGDGSYVNGENYTKTLALDFVGDGILNYRFYAKDSSALAEQATGAPTSNSTVTVTNNVPTLAWTGQADYVSDGVNPDSGSNGSSFEFRVKYTDIDNTAPSSIQVWADINDDTDYLDPGEKQDMTVISGQDGDYTNGEFYAKTVTFNYAPAGGHTYRFVASDGNDDATGSPTSDNIMTITNTQPIGGYSADNVIPASQITQSSSGDGIITINWKGRDDESNNVTLKTFEYSVNGGTDWNAPANGDSSTSLSTNWTDSDGAGTGYTTATTFGAATAHSFTFDTDHADVTGMDGVDQSDVQIRFTLNDGQDSASPATSENFQVDNAGPTDTIVSASYDEATDTLTITGTNFTTIADAGTDVKSYVDWSKFVWDINGDGATPADITFVVGDVTSLTVTDATTLTLVFTSAKGTSIEATSGYGSAGGADTLDVTAGFSKDAFGNASTTDAVADAPFSTVQSVVGTVYTDEGVTTIADGALVRLIKNGSSVGTDTTSSGAYTIATTIAAGDALIVYIDGHATDGTTVTIAGSTSPTLDIYGGHLITRHDNSGSLTNANMDTAKGSYVDDEILYSISGSDMTTTVTALYIPSSHTYAPGGAVTAVDVDVNGTFNPAANAVNVSGNWDATGGVFTSTGTITFNASTGTKTITPGGTDADHDFQNITFNDSAGSATFQLGGAIDVDGNFTVTDGIVDTTGSNYAITVAGNFSQAMAGQVEANGSTITVGGDFSADGTTDSTDYNSASLVLTGTGGLSYANLASSYLNGFNNLTVGQSGNTTTVNNNLSVQTLLTVGSGEMTGSSVILLRGTGDVLSFDASSNVSVTTLSFNATSASQNLPSLTNGYSSDIRVTNQGTTVVQTGAITINGTNDLLVNGSGFADRVVTYNTAGYDLTIGGDLILGAGSDTATKTLTATNSTVTVGGNFTINHSSNMFTSTGSTVVLNGSADQTVTSSGKTFNNLTLNNTGTSGSDDIVIADALDINGTLTITNGDLDIGTNDPAVNTAGTVSIASNGSIDVTGRTANWTFDGTTTLTDSSSGQDFEDVVLNGTSLTLGSNMKVQTMTNTAGTLDLGSSGYTIEIDGTGTPLSNSGTFTAGTSTVKYTGSGSATDIAAVAYSSLQLTPTSSTTYSLTGNLTSGNALTGDLTIDSNAILDAVSGNNYGVTAVDITNNGTYTAQNSTITFSGNWDNNGTFTTGNSSVVLNGGSQQLYGSATFYNLNKSVTSAATLTFEAGATTTIAAGGLVTLNGAASNLLTLTSSASGAWYLNIAQTASKSINYVDVEWGDASGSHTDHTPIDPENSVDSGNNTDWFSVIGGITVTTTVDENDGSCDDGDCSLRDAINKANESSDENTINVPAGTYQITLAGGGEDSNATGDFDIIYPVNIVGAGSGTTFIQAGPDRANALDRVFHNTASVAVLIEGVTVRYGMITDDGGCIRTAGNLTIRSSVVDDCMATSNDGGAVYASAGTLTIDNSTISNSTADLNGGAIYTTGLTITNGAAFTNNSSSNFGGAIYNQTNDITMDGTVTFTNNDTPASATNDMGGAIWSSGNISHTSGSISFTNNDAYQGGAIYLNTANKSISLYAATFDTNTATLEGGAIYGYGPLSITGGATFTDNSAGNHGGAIYNKTYDITMDGTILFVNNEAGPETGKNTSDYGGAIWSSGNITHTHGPITFENNNAYHGGGIFMNTTGTTVTLDAPIFTNNTATLSGGAIYAQGLAVTGGGTFQNNSGGNHGGAIYNVNGDITLDGDFLFDDNDTPGIDTGDYGGAIYTTGSVTHTSGTITFQNNDAYHGGGIYLATDGKTVSLDTAVFTNNTATLSGGAILTKGLTIADGGTFRNNMGGNHGGAIYNTGTAMTMNGMLIFDNNDSGPETGKNTSDYGGAIYSTTNVTLNNTSGTSTFNNNDAYQGGAICFNDSTARFYATNATFTNNTATNVGGAVRMYGGTLTNVTFSNNSANQGGAIFNNTAQLNIEGSNNSFTDNDALTGHGGAIYTAADVVINDATFTSNSAPAGQQGGAIYNYASTTCCTTTVTDSTFTGNTAGNLGGAIYSRKEITATRTTFTNNEVTDSGGRGGAAFTSGTFTADRSTIDNNSSADDGGGVWAEGIASYNSTFSGNTATSAALAATGGAIFHNGAYACTIYNSTFYGNSAPSNADSLRSAACTIKNTIFDNSTTDADGNTNNCNSTGHTTTNTIENRDTCNASTPSTDPLLVPVLEDNGGPTKTHALQLIPTISPAIDAGDNTTCADASTINNLDQRGETRPANGGVSSTCDIGAYEFVDLATTVTVCSSGCDFTTINGAIDDSSTTTGDTVLVAAGTWSENINFDGKAITVKGQNGSANTTIQGLTSYNTNPVVTFSSGETFSAILDGFTLDNNQTTGSSRGVYISNASPTIKRSIIENNTANNGTNGGGGVYITLTSDVAAPTFDEVTIRANTAENRNGCGMYITGAYGGATITNSTIGGANAADANDCGINSGYGGGIYFTGSSSGTLSISDTTIQNNTVAKKGGGIYVTGVTNATVITDSTITENECSNEWGGGIYSYGSPLTITDTDINSNTVNTYGGGLALDGDGADATITGGSIDSNTVSNSGGSGGGIYLLNGADLTYTGGSVSDNTGNTLYGGGIRVASTGSVLNLIKMYIQGNKSVQHGGGIYLAAGSEATITNSTISGNAAGSSNWEDGGGIWTNGTLNIYSSTIAGNYAGDGGAIYNDASSVTTITNSILWDNTAGNGSTHELTEIVGSSVTINYSDVEGCTGYTACNGGTGNIDSDPLFVTAAQATAGTPTTSGDFHLQTGSGVVDQGTTTDMPVDDIDGNYRYMGDGVDMGSDERE